MSGAMLLSIALFGLGFWMWLYAGPIFIQLQRRRRPNLTVAPSDADDHGAEAEAKKARVAAGRRLFRCVAAALWIAGGLIAWLGART